MFLYSTYEVVLLLGALLLFIFLIKGGPDDR